MAWFNGERSVEEQLRGLTPALAHARSKTVADFGCAEGHIAARFAEAGASSVYACDMNAEFIVTAKKLHKDSRLCFFNEEITAVMKVELCRYDVVLALAILHKMHDVAAVAQFFAASTRELLVIRLPMGCKNGVVHSKHEPGAKCDILKLMPECGLYRTADRLGPRGERVWYFERL